MPAPVLKAANNLATGVVTVSTATPISITLPTGITSSDNVYVVAGWNTPRPQGGYDSGWDQLIASGNNYTGLQANYLYLFGRAGSAALSGTTFTVTIGAATGVAAWWLHAFLITGGILAPATHSVSGVPSPGVSSQTSQALTTATPFNAEQLGLTIFQAASTGSGTSTTNSVLLYSTGGGSAITNGTAMTSGTNYQNNFYVGTLVPGTSETIVSNPVRNFRSGAGGQILFSAPAAPIVKSGRGGTIAGTGAVTARRGAKNTGGSTRRAALSGSGKITAQRGTIRYGGRAIIAGSGKITARAGSPNRFATGTPRIIGTATIGGARGTAAIAIVKTGTGHLSAVGSITAHAGTRTATGYAAGARLVAAGQITAQAGQRVATAIGYLSAVGSLRGAGQHDGTGQGALAATGSLAGQGSGYWEVPPGPAVEPDALPHSGTGGADIPASVHSSAADIPGRASVHH